ncbi:hypothetical protein FQA39_LY08679 [Lamprigera yunnana]|nr:hypothetical protein FQA39_LY08679 [Lamprigera yunnana]
MEKFLSEENDKNVSQIVSKEDELIQAHFTNSLNRGSPKNTEAKVSVPSDIFKNILDFVYTGYCVIKANNVELLLKAADQYDVLGVLQLCCRYILEHLTGSSTINLVECYDADANEWFDAYPLNLNRSALSACVISELPNVKDYCYTGKLNSEDGEGVRTRQDVPTN